MKKLYCTRCGSEMIGTERILQYNQLTGVPIKIIKWKCSKKTWISIFHDSFDTQLDGEIIGCYYD